MQLAFTLYDNAPQSYLTEVSNLLVDPAAQSSSSMQVDDAPGTSVIALAVIVLEKRVFGQSLLHLCLRASCVHSISKWEIALKE